MHMYLMVIGAKDSKTGHRIGFLLRYGRSKLISFAEPILPTDEPIEPGLKHLFKFSEGDASGWNYLRTYDGKADPKGLELEFQILNFGDGTGFTSTAAEPVDIHKITKAPPNTNTTSSTSSLPASFFSVNLK